jgi:hypothetical protein
MKIFINAYKCYQRWFSVTILCGDCLYAYYGLFMRFRGLKLPYMGGGIRGDFLCTGLVWLTVGDSPIFGPGGQRYAFIHEL